MKKQNGSIDQYYSTIKRQIFDTSISINQTKQLIEKTKTQEFSSDVPTRYLKTLEEITNWLSIRLAENNKFLEEEFQAGSLDKILDIGETVWLLLDASVKLRPFSRHAAAANVENVPWSLLRQFERLCESIDKDLNILIRSRWNFRYDINPINYQIEKELKEVKGLGHMLKDEDLYVVLTFPNSEKTNILSHGIWAHELSHYIDIVLAEDSFSDQELDAQKRDLDSHVVTYSNVVSLEIEKLIEQTIREIQENNTLKLPENIDIDESQLNKISDLFTTKYKILRRWITEIFCDLVAIRVFGPVYLFSFFEVSEKESYFLGTMFRTHPPNRIRLQIMANELKEYWLRDVIDVSKKENLKEHEEIIITEIDRIIETCEIDDQRKLYKKRFGKYDIVLKVIAGIASYLREEVREFERDYFLDFKTCLNEVDSVFKYILMNVPPNKPSLKQGESPISLQAILTTGWLMWYKETRKSLSLEQNTNHNLCKGIIRTFNITNQMLLKAIESSEIQIQYSELKNAGNKG